MRKIWVDDAWYDYIYWQASNKKVANKINNLLKSIDRNGYKCIGKPELLKGNRFSGCWSVRIDKKNRLIFRIDNDCIIIMQCRSHYGDK